MTTTQAKRKLEAARKTGRARIFDNIDGTTYDLWYHPEDKSYSLTYNDGHYEQTVTVTSNPKKIIDLIID